MNHSQTGFIRMVNCQVFINVARVASLILFIAIWPLVIDFGLFHDDYLILAGLSPKVALTLGTGLFRPIPFLLMYFSKCLGDANFFGHMMNGLIAYSTLNIAVAVVVKILAEYNVDTARLTLRQSVFAGLVFVSLVFHYSTTWNFMWISGIQTLLWGFFIVLSIKYFRNLMMHDDNHNLRVAFLLLIYALGLLSYEGSLTIPLLLLGIYAYHVEWPELLNPERKVVKLFGGYLLVGACYYLIRVVNGAFSGPGTSNLVRKMYAFIELFLAIADPTNKPIFSYIVDLQLPLFPNDILPIMVTTLGSAGLFAALLADRSKRMGLKNAGLIFVLFLSSIPIFFGRRAFSGRLAFGLIFPFAVGLSYWARDVLRRNMVAILASCFWLVLSVYSLANFTNLVSQIGVFKSQWFNVIVDNYLHHKNNVVGLSFDSFFGYYAVGDPTNPLSYDYGLEIDYTGLVCSVLDRSFKPSVSSLSHLVRAKQVGERSWLFTVVNERVKCMERGFVGMYSVDELIQFPAGSIVVKRVNRRGYLTEFELTLLDDSILLDAEMYK